VVEALPAGDTAGRLEALGFAGLIVNRKGFADGGAEWLEGLAAAGRPETMRSADGDLVFVRLLAIPHGVSRLTVAEEPAPID
jgi:hypothetical protein